MGALFVSMDSDVYLGFDKEVMRRFGYKQVLQWAIITAIFLYLGKLVWENWGEVKEANFSFHPSLLLLGTFVFAASYFIQIGAWYLVTLKLGIALPPLETLESWLYSLLGKYLPGKVWLLLGRFYLYQSKGKSKKAISIALYFETATVIMAAALISLMGLIFFKGIRPLYPGRELGWLIVLFVPIFIALHPGFLEKIVNRILSRLRREPISLAISYRDVLWILLICIWAWLVGGIGFYLFVSSIFPLSPDYVPFLTASLAISSTLGLIALFAPGGLGVREGVLVFLLSGFIPGAAAVIVSVLTRIWMTAIEIVLIGVVYLIAQFGKSFEKKIPHV
jgi:uncharacterized membrane protein YbhN (UPF0104 family)